MKKIGIVTIALMCGLTVFAQGLKPIKSTTSPIKNFQFDAIALGEDGRVQTSAITDGTLFLGVNPLGKEQVATPIVLFNETGQKIPITQLLHTKKGMIVVGVLESPNSKNYYISPLRNGENDKLKGQLFHSIELAKKQVVESENIAVSETKDKLCLSYAIIDGKSEMRYGYVVISDVQGEDVKSFKINFNSPNLSKDEPAIFNAFIGNFNGVVVVYNEQLPDAKQSATKVVKLNKEGEIENESYLMSKDGMLLNGLISSGRFEGEVLISGFVYHPSYKEDGFESLYSGLFNFQEGMLTEYMLPLNENIAYTNVSARQSSELKGNARITSDFVLKGAKMLESESVIFYAENLTIGETEETKNQYTHDILLLNVNPEGKMNWGTVVPNRHKMEAFAYKSINEISKVSPTYWNTNFVMKDDNLYLLNRTPIFEKELRAISKYNYLTSWITVNVNEGVSRKEEGLDEVRENPSNIYVKKYLDVVKR